MDRFGNAVQQIFIKTPLMRRPALLVNACSLRYRARVASSWGRGVGWGQGQRAHTWKERGRRRLLLRARRLLLRPAQPLHGADHGAALQLDLLLQHVVGPPLSIQRLLHFPQALHRGALLGAGDRSRLDLLPPHRLPVCRRFQVVQLHRLCLLAHGVLHRPGQLRGLAVCVPPLLGQHFSPHLGLLCSRRTRTALAQPLRRPRRRRLPGLCRHGAIALPCPAPVVAGALGGSSGATPQGRLATGQNASRRSVGGRLRVKLTIQTAATQGRQPCARVVTIRWR
mmetsp:Transcript_36220/g.92579  ORF Transcript_36220/g.92579 Transcript_36220/m.92579 type:complete len:282 (-) Transcript_36220:8-853(-)